jgi:hypothetical protein
MAGELDAGNPHVQFDEGALETCDSVTRLRPTLRLAPLAEFEAAPHARVARLPPAMRDTARLAKGPLSLISVVFQNGGIGQGRAVVARLAYP